MITLDMIEFIPPNINRKKYLMRVWELAKLEREEAEKNYQLLRAKETKNSKRKYYRDKKNNPLRRYAGQLAWRANSYKLKVCIKCGKINAHGHHPDYNKPLEVIYLCPYHHKQAHPTL